MASAASGAIPYKIRSIGYHAWALSGGAPERAIGLTAARAAVRRAEADMSEKVLNPCGATWVTSTAPTWAH